MKKVIAAILSVVFMLCAVGCGGQEEGYTDNTSREQTTEDVSEIVESATQEPPSSIESNVTDNSTSPSVTEQTTVSSVEPIPEYLSPNKDGVIPLGHYTDAASLGLCKTQLYPKDEEHLFTLEPFTEGDPYYTIVKSAHTSIPKVDRKNTIAIYGENYDSLSMIPIGDISYYTFNLNFADSESLTPNLTSFFKHPIRLSRQLKESVLWKNGLADTVPIEECNGVPIIDFVQSNSESFVQSEQEQYYTLIKAQGGKNYEFGGYTGTTWISNTITPDLELYKVPQDAGVVLQTNKTKNGYFTVDCSNLKPGIYYISAYNTMLQFV